MDDKLLINLLEKRKVFWEPIVAAALLLVAILGTMVPLYIHSDSRCTQQIAYWSERTEKQIESIKQEIKESRKEAQEFRERVNKQDQEFRERLIQIELSRNSRNG